MAKKFKSLKTRRAPRPELWDVHDCAHFLKHSESWVYANTTRYRKDGIPVFKLEGKSLRFWPEEVIAWVRENAERIEAQEAACINEIPYSREQFPDSNPVEVDETPENVHPIRPEWRAIDPDDPDYINPIRAKFRTGTDD